MRCERMAGLCVIGMSPNHHKIENNKSKPDAIEGGYSLFKYPVRSKDHNTAKIEFIITGREIGNARATLLRE